VCVLFLLTLFCIKIFILGGETIKQINQQTGAHCELDRRNQSNENEKIFIIRGNPEQVEHAKRIFSEKLGMVRLIICIRPFLYIFSIIFYLLFKGSSWFFICWSTRSSWIQSKLEYRVSSMAKSTTIQ